MGSGASRMCSSKAGSYKEGKNQRQEGKKHFALQGPNHKIFALITVDSDNNTFWQKICDDLSAQNTEDKIAFLKEHAPHLLGHAPKIPSDSSGES